MTLTEFGESSSEHTRRAGVALGDLSEADRQDRLEKGDKARLSSRTVSSTRLLEAIGDIELEAAIKTNPDSTPEERDEMLATLKRIKDSEKKQNGRNR